MAAYPIVVIVKITYDWGLTFDFILLPAFYGLNHFGESFIWIFTLCFALFGAMINGSYVVLISESFPAHLRYSGVGFSYSLGIALFGGIAPLAFTQLIHTLKLPEAPALYLLICACATLIAILCSEPRKKILVP